MTLKGFTDLMREKVVAWAQARPQDYDWKLQDVISAYDQAIAEMYLYELPASIELDPEI